MAAIAQTLSKVMVNNTGCDIFIEYHIQKIFVGACVRPSMCNVMLFIAKIVAKARVKQTVRSTV